LTKILKAQGTTVSTVVRTWIDQAYQELDREERLRAVQRLTTLGIKDVPDPEVLCRQLDDTYDVGPLP